MDLAAVILIFEPEYGRPGTIGRIPVRRMQHTRKHFPAVNGRAQPDFRPFTGEAKEITLRLQRPVNPGRTDIQPAVVNILDVINPGQLSRNAFAIFNTDAFRAVNRDTQQSPGRALDVDELDTQACNCLVGQYE